MKTYTLQAELRTSGIDAKHLRKSGRIPATVYGKGIDAVSISVDEKQFRQVFRTAGETAVIDLDIKGKVHPVLVDTVQMHPVFRHMLNIEFHQVNLLEKVKATIPLLLIGEAPAVTEKKGILLELLHEIEVEALPKELPEHIEVSLISLTDLDTEITVADLVVSKAVTILTDPARPIARITAIVVQEEPVSEPVDVSAVPLVGEKEDGENSEPKTPEKGE